VHEGIATIGDLSRKPEKAEAGKEIRTPVCYAKGGRKYRVVRRCRDACWKRYSWEAERRCLGEGGHALEGVA